MDKAKAVAVASRIFTVVMVTLWLIFIYVASAMVWVAWRALQ